MVPLRVLAVCSNLAFFAYGLGLRLAPVLRAARHLAADERVALVADPLVRRRRFRAVSGPGVVSRAGRGTGSGKGWRTPARASVGRRCCGGVGGGSRATPKGRNRGRADAVSSGVVLWGFERAGCDWGRWRWRCCRHTRRKGRLCAVPDVGFWEIGSDSGPGLHGGRPSAGTPVAGGPAQVARSCFDWRCASWSTKRPRRRPDMKRRR